MKKFKILGKTEYCYKIYEKEGSDEWGVFLLGALQDIDNVAYFSEYFSNTVNTLVIETPTLADGELDATISIREQAQMILDLVINLKIKKTHLWAFSYATAISVELCDLWDGIQSLSIACGVPGIPQSGRQATFDMIAASTRSNEEFANVFTNCLLSDAPEIPKAAAIRRATVKAVNKFDDEKRRLFAENSVRLLSHKPTNLNSIDIPCLVLAGESDPYATKEITSEFQQKIKHAHYVSIKNSDHMLHLQQPEKAAEALITLAKQHVAAVSTFKELEK